MTLPEDPDEALKDTAYYLSNLVNSWFKEKMLL